MRIRAVAFDIDGTLYPNYRMLLHSLPSFFIDPGLFLAFTGARIAVRQHEANVSHVEMQLTKVASRLGISNDEAQERIRKQLFTVWEKSYRGIRPFRGVNRALSELREHGLVLAALSDFPVGRKLRYLGVESYFQFAFCSEETGYLKPHPAPFDELSRRLGVPPAEVLFIGNSYEKDVKGAKGAGMMTGWFTRAFSSRHSRDNPAISCTGSADAGTIDFRFRSYNRLVSTILEALPDNELGTG